MSELFAELFAKRPHVIKPGLERIKAGWTELHYPSRLKPSVLIGGTNGKGSTSGFLYALMRPSRTKVGLYTSPHLINFSERIQCSHEVVDDERLFREWEQLRQRLSPQTYEILSFFEATTLMAMQVFQDNGCEFNIWEVGLGGRWDATNVLDPSASVVVSLGHDHEAWLGSDIQAIAQEKLGIIRSGRPLFWGNCSYFKNHAGVRALVETTARDQGSPLWWMGEHFGLQDEHTFFIALPGMNPHEGHLPLTLQDAPPYLKGNFVLSAAVYHWMHHNLDLPRRLPSLVDALQEFDRNPELPPHMVGRFTRLTVVHQGQPIPVLLDVCHNVEGVQALAAGVGECFPSRQGSLPGVVSILKDKDLNGMLDILRSFLNPLVLFKVDNERTLCREDLEERHRDLPLVSSFEEAWHRMVSFSRPSQAEPLVICGSVFAVGQVLNSWGIQPGYWHAGKQLVADDHSPGSSGNNRSGF